jgi:NADPH-dependent F420 reductase
VDVTVPMRFVGGRADYWEQGAGSGAESLVSRVPAGVRLVGAFKTIPAHVLADLSQSLDCDMFVCGDSKDAVSRIMEISGMIATLRPLNAGPLASARILERMTVLAANLNRTYKKKGARFFIVGI